MSQTNCSRVQINCSKHTTHCLAFTSSPSMSLHLSFLRSLSLWIIITYHTGLITASKRVSMKTLITVLGAEHSALIPSHTSMKSNSWEKQERKPVQRLFFNGKFVLSLNVINIQQRTPSLANLNQLFLMVIYDHSPQRYSALFFLCCDYTLCYYKRLVLF